MKYFRQVYLCDRFRPCEIRDCLVQFKHPVVRLRSQLQLSHGNLHQRLAWVIQRNIPKGVLNA